MGSDESRIPLKRSVRSDVGPNCSQKISSRRQYSPVAGKKIIGRNTLSVYFVYFSIHCKGVVFSQYVMLILARR